MADSNHFSPLHYPYAVGLAAALPGHGSMRVSIGLTIHAISAFGKQML
jgi:hypothetical protein